MCARITSIRPVEEMHRITRSRRSRRISRSNRSNTQRTPSPTQTTQDTYGSQHTPQYNLAPSQDIPILLSLPQHKTSSGKAFKKGTHSKNAQQPLSDSFVKASELTTSSSSSLQQTAPRDSEQNPQQSSPAHGDDSHDATSTDCDNTDTHESNRVLEFAKWGLVLSKPGSSQPVFPLHNIRSDNPRLLYSTHLSRCVILADAFFEWSDQQTGGHPPKGGHIDQSTIHSAFSPLDASHPSIMIPTPEKCNEIPYKAIPSESIIGKRKKQPYVIYSSSQLCSKCGFRVTKSLSPERMAKLKSMWDICCCEDTNGNGSDNTKQEEEPSSASSTSDHQSHQLSDMVKAHNERAILSSDMLYIAGICSEYTPTPDQLDSIPSTWRTEVDPSLTQPLLTAGMVTIDANPQIHWLHERMPLILTPEQVLDWLDPSISVISFFKKHLTTYLIPNHIIVSPTPSPSQPQSFVTRYHHQKHPSHLFHGRFDPITSAQMEVPEANFATTVVSGLDKIPHHMLATHTPVFTTNPMTIPLRWYPISSSLTKYTNGQLNNNSTVLLHLDSWKERAFTSGIGRFIAKSPSKEDALKQDDEADPITTNTPVKLQLSLYFTKIDSDTPSNPPVASSIVSSSLLNIPQKPPQSRSISTPILDMFHKRKKRTKYHDTGAAAACDDDGDGHQLVSLSKSTQIADVASSGAVEPSTFKPPLDQIQPDILIQDTPSTPSSRSSVWLHQKSTIHTIANPMTSTNIDSDDDDDITCSSATKTKEDEANEDETKDEKSDDDIQVVKVSMSSHNITTLPSVPTININDGHHNVSNGKGLTDKHHASSNESDEDNDDDDTIAFIEDPQI